MVSEPLEAPLSGLRVDLTPVGAAGEVAAWLLVGLGVSVDVASRRSAPSAVSPTPSPTTGSPHILWTRTESIPQPLPPAGRNRTDSRLTLSGARLRRSPIALSDAGLPEGTLVYATGVALAAGAIAGLLSGATVTVDEVAVAVEMRLPDVLAASYATSNPMRPARPRRAPGGGFYHADLGAPGASEDFERLMGTLPGDVAAREVASQAQLWRLAVCDYRARKRPPEPARIPVRFDATPVAEPGKAAPAPGPTRPGGRLDFMVVDLTSMWAGPLATRLLGDLGATVTKVEPAFRPDGTRAVAGGGIYPGGVQALPGRDSAMWNALNRWKLHEDLDLREPAAVDRFVSLVRRADVVIDSFSPRVLANLDLPGRVGPDTFWVSMPAFGPGGQRDWVAYGTGVHAQSGLGDTWPVPGNDNAAEGFYEPAVSYPDPLGGLTGALAVLAGLAARRIGRRATRAEVSLDEAIQPLCSVVDGVTSTGRRDCPGRSDGISTSRCRSDEEGRKLLDVASKLGLTATWEVAGRALRHPAGPLRL